MQALRNSGAHTFPGPGFLRARHCREYFRVSLWGLYSQVGKGESLVVLQGCQPAFARTSWCGLRRHDARGGEGMAPTSDQDETPD